MNKIFSFKRFGTLMLKDLKEYYSKFGTTMLAILAFYLGYWLVNVLFGGAPEFAEDRMEYVGFLIAICAFIAPFKLYGECNNKMSGITYAMLPVSSFEKFLSMILYTSIISVFLFTILILGLDTILCLFPFNGGFEGTLFNDTVFNKDNIEIFFTIILLQSAFIFGNLFFRTHKGSKTVFSFLILQFVLMTIAIIIFSSIGWENLSITGTNIIVNGKIVAEGLEGHPIYKWIEVLSYLYAFGMPLTFYILSFFRIKNLKY